MATRTHTRADWTYAMRVSAGIHDLRNLYVRTNACVAGHQNVDADILQAGHPALVFELDSQSVNEPKHWREDESMIGPRSWLIGQAVALREIAWTVNKATPEERDRLFARRDAEKWNPTNAELMSILQTLAASDSEFRSNNGSRENRFYCALRLTLAVERLSAALGISEKINKESSSLRGDVQLHYDFDSAAFAEHLRALRQKL